MKGVSSSGCVSGTVQTGGASLSSGLGMMRDLLVDVVHWPLTKLVTAWGWGEEPSERGSSVAQDGRLDRQRRLLWRRAAADEEERSRLESILGSNNTNEVVILLGGVSVSRFVNASLID